MYHLINDNLSNPHGKVDNIHRVSNYANRVIAVIGSNQSVFRRSNSNWRHSRILLGFRLNKGTRSYSINANVASDVRNHSTSIEAQVNEKSFDRFYIQGGLNLKRLVIDIIESGKDIAKVEEEVRTDVNDESCVNVKHPDNSHWHNT
ncbi:hypothetical protein RDI58_001173 [Solanum bulbocastanum]|uniref:Uncharacterized protein n=1 Tax=Solanum bulbocastanum TaxID=147425 RepID=A0AAN8U4L4_SOLBU